MHGRTGSSLLLSGGRVIDPANGMDQVADVLLVDGCVEAVGTALPAPEGVTDLDATGFVVTPGFIDSHVHLRDPGFEHKETIASGTSAAAAGGFTAIAAMPNTDPPPDEVPHLEDVIRRGKRDGKVRVYVIGCITRGRRGQQLAPLQELATAGAVAFSDDGDPVEDERLMRQALQISQQIGRPIFPHEEFRAISDGGCMHAGDIAQRLGVKGMPPAAEDDMIARDIELVRQTGGALHIAHISTAGTVDLVRAAKADGLPVTCEVLPHHFYLTDEEVERQGAMAKMAPPLRSDGDVEAMKAGLADGTIDTIATDHAPHTAQEKALSLEQAPFGIVGLETAIGLSMTILVEGGRLDLPTLVEKWTWAPASILGLPGGRLTPGAVGDVTILDPECRWTVDPAAFCSKSTNTPFVGMDLVGRAVATIVAGQIVYQDGFCS
ncbi:MAG TPA: dihydroorotase [Candidatus Latescibacteria bacterium]|nr:dihydroorotase [Candidatus Latescibacterota bacterium]